MIQTPYAKLVRTRVIAYCSYLSARAAELAYQEYWPMRSFGIRWCTVPKKPTDCSESASLILHASGAPTPYVTQTPSGYMGYTGTMLDTLKHVRRRFTRRGDFAVFVTREFPMGAHVVILLQGGIWHRDPLVWSHGRQGVDEMPLSEMTAGFPGCHVVFLRSVPLTLRKPR